MTIESPHNILSIVRDSPERNHGDHGLFMPPEAVWGAGVLARFHYSMQSILDIKQKMETQKKQAFSAARAVLDEEEERLDGLCRRKQGYQEEAVRLLSGILNMRDVEENCTAILRMDGFIADQQVRVSDAEEKLELARAEMTEAMKERKTHENLKEKAFEQFLVEENRRESKEVDELTSYVYGQRRRASQIPRSKIAGHQA